MKKIKSTKKELLFRKGNYQFLLLSIIIIGIGFVLMVGGGSSDPNIFNQEIFNFRRIRLAPALVLVGFGVAVYSILTSPKK